jgi:hypothetical protein
MLPRFVPVLSLFLLIGCTTQPAEQELPTDHPANPAAPEAPPTERSSTLSFATADPLPHDSSGVAVFICPMHPEVTSANPNDRCPKCGMKIDKPVQPHSPGGVTKPAATPTGESAHEGHGGHH